MGITIKMNVTFKSRREEKDKFDIDKIILD